MFDVNPLALKYHLKDLDRQFENRPVGRPLRLSHGTRSGRAFSFVGQCLHSIKLDRAVPVAATVLIAVFLLV